MNYKYTLIVETETDEEIFNSWCLTEEGVSEELLRKASHAIAKYEDDKELEAQAEFDRQREEDIEGIETTESKVSAEILNEQ